MECRNYYSNIILKIFFINALVNVNESRPYRPCPGSRDALGCVVRATKKKNLKKGERRF